MPPPPLRQPSIPKIDLGPLKVIARSWLAIVLVLGIAWLALSSFYTVPTDSRGVVLRLGKHLSTVPPGLHFKLPFGIDRVIKVATERQHKLEFGYPATVGYTNPHQASAEPQMERAMITGDLNAALVEWSVQYRVSSPEDFLFNVREPEETLRDLAEAVAREIVGDRTVDEVITVGRQEIEKSCLDKLRQAAKDYELGIDLDQFQLMNVTPPREVQASFSEVNQAQQERARLINVAEGNYKQAVPKARGEAAQKIQAAEGYRFKRVNEAQGDVASFNATLEQYVKAPDVTRTRLYLESMSEVLPQIGRKVIVDESLRQVWPFLPGMTGQPATPNRSSQPAQSNPRTTSQP